MGLKRWIIEKWGGTLEEKREEADKEVKGYELYDHAPGGKWVKALDLTEPVDFEELEDAVPGHTYKLQVRYKTGQVRQIWYRHIPGAVEERVIDPIDQMEKSLAPMVKFGERLTTLRETIQGAFGWAFPQPTTGGGGGAAPPYRGDLPILLHPAVPGSLKAWSPVFREWTKDITAGIREGILGGGSEEKEEPEKKVEFKKPSPKPGDYLQKEEPGQEAK